MRRHNPNNRLNRRHYREIDRINAVTMHYKEEKENLAGARGKDDRALSTSNLSIDILNYLVNPNSYDNW